MSKKVSEILRLVQDQNLSQQEIADLRFELKRIQDEKWYRVLQAIKEYSQSIQTTVDNTHGEEEAG